MTNEIIEKDHRKTSAKGPVRRDYSPTQLPTNPTPKPPASEKKQNNIELDQFKANEDLAKKWATNESET
jgi:hypothetical protein